MMRLRLKSRGGSGAVGAAPPALPTPGPPASPLLLPLLLFSLRPALPPVCASGACHRRPMEAWLVSSDALAPAAAADRRMASQPCCHNLPRCCRREQCFFMLPCPPGCCASACPLPAASKCTCPAPAACPLTPACPHDPRPALLPASPPADCTTAAAPKRADPQSRSWGGGCSSSFTPQAPCVASFSNPRKG